MKVVLSKDNYYENSAVTTGYDTFTFGDVPIHAYKKIGVFFYVNPGYQVTEAQIDGQINAYQDILENKGFTESFLGDRVGNVTEFFVFQDTGNFGNDFANVANYEREHDIVFLYTFSHGADTGWLKLGGQTYPDYRVHVDQILYSLESLDSDRVGWLLTSCFSGCAYDDAINWINIVGTESSIFLLTSANDEISQFYCPGDGWPEQPYRCAFAYPFFNLIASGYNAIEAYNIAKDETLAPYYDHVQYPLMYNGIDNYIFFD